MVMSGNRQPKTGDVVTRMSHNVPCKQVKHSQYGHFEFWGNMVE